jgi:hypothetical protein
MKTILTLIVAALLCGCVGTNFTFNQASQMKVGMT